LTYNFAGALTETTTLNLYTLATKLLMSSSFQNCELKQEPCTLSTELQQTHEFHGYGKNKNPAHYQPSYNKLTNSTVTEKNIYSAAPEMWGRNCSEIVTSGGTFVLTLNRASAVKVEDSEQNFLLPQNIVAITEESV